MKIRKVYIFAITLVLICSTLVFEYHDYDDFKAISILLQAYSGVNIYGNISGYTLALYIGLNVSIIMITMNSVNSIFDMYNYIYVRCYSKNKFILMCMQYCIYQATFLTLTNLIINLGSFIILDNNIYFDCLFLSIYLFFNAVELFIFECILFTIKFKFKLSILVIFSISVLTPILNTITPNIFRWLAFYPTSNELLNYKAIILKVVFIIILLLILKFLLKTYDGINEKDST